MADFALESSAFDHAQPIPSHYTWDGEDLSPPLRWANVPDGTRSLALLVDDPDAPSGVFTHWVAWGLDPGVGGLDEGEAAPGEGRNDFGRVGYGGPCPPSGHGRHRYVSASTPWTWNSSLTRVRESSTWSRRSRSMCSRRPTSSARTNGSPGALAR